MAGWWSKLQRLLSAATAPVPETVRAPARHDPARDDDQAAQRAISEACQAHEAGDFDRASALALAITGPAEVVAAALEVAARAALRTRRHPGTWRQDLPPPPLGREDRRAAISLYRQAMALDPTRVPPRWELSRLLDAASDERLALLGELAPVRTSVDVLVELGDCHCVRGEYDDARLAYEQIVQTAPRDVEPYRRLELLCLRLRDLAGAKRWRRAASERSLPRDSRSERSTQVSTDVELPPAWCAVANVVAAAPRGPGGELIREGTKHFKPGAKVYCFSAYWGTAGDRVRVVGRARKSHRWITVAMPSKLLCDARPKLCYEPAVLKRINNEVPHSRSDRESAEHLAALINRVSVAATVGQKKE